MNILPNNPFYSQYRKFNTQYPATEILGNVLYDTVQFVSAATLNLAFFTAGPRATVDLTNMENPAQLPANKAMLIRGVNFFVRQVPRSTARTAAGQLVVGAVDNICQLVNDGVLTLTIGNKPYLQIPLWMIPSGGGPYAIAGLDGNTADPGIIIDYAQNGVPMADNIFLLSQPLFLSPQMNFRVDITWPAVITLAGGNTLVEVLLEGDVLRPVQ